MIEFEIHDYPGNIEFLLTDIADMYINYAKCNISVDLREPVTNNVIYLRATSNVPINRSALRQALNDYLPDYSLFDIK